MSYILEALKKSEKERQREEIPDLQADHSFPSAKRQEHKTPVRYLFGVLLLGVAGALIWWKFPSFQIPQLADNSKKISVPSPAVQAPEALLPSEQAVAPLPEDKGQIAPEVSAAEVSEKMAEVATEAQVPEANEQIAPEVSAPEAIEKVDEVARDASLPSEEAVTLLSEGKKMITSEVSAPGASKEETAAARESAPSTAPESVGQDEAAIPLLEELPAAVKKGIPALSFAGHVYAEDAQKRLIIINSRIVREGDLISNGLSLEQIDLNSVVLRYKKSVFRVQLF